VNLDGLRWFPDGKHLLLIGGDRGSVAADLRDGPGGGKPQPFGPPDFTGGAVAKDGKRIAGQSASGEVVVFDRETQKEHVVPALGPPEAFEKWTEDGQARLVSSGKRMAVRMCRVDAVTGKRTLLQTVELSENAGSMSKLRLQYKPEQQDVCLRSPADSGDPVRGGGIRVRNPPSPQPSDGLAS
jgi:hypothetical protein